MYYRVTVMKDGKHYFSTDRESCPTVSQAVLLYHDLNSRFLRDAGFSVMLFEVAQTALIVDPLVVKHRRISHA